MGKIDINHLDIYTDDQPSTEKIRKGKKFKDDDRQSKKKK